MFVVEIVSRLTSACLTYTEAILLSFIVHADIALFTKASESIEEGGGGGGGGGLQTGTRGSLREPSDSCEIAVQNDTNATEVAASLQVMQPERCFSVQ